VVSAGVVVALAASGALFVVDRAVTVPLYRDSGLRVAPLPEASTVYASDGSELGKLGVEDRESVAFAQIPTVLVHAVIATEDHTFWDNPGIDVRGITRALVADARSGRIEQGGSTITEQFVKEILLDPKHDAALKLNEIVLAVRAAHKMTKTQILTDYMNAVYFGEGAYGVKAAAGRFFASAESPFGPIGKSLDQLTLPDAALLAGLIAGPSDYDPFAHPDLARDRRAFVLDQMVARRYITRADADAAAAAPLPTGAVPVALGAHSAVVAEVQQLLLTDPRLGDTPAKRRDAVLEGGLQIYTTIDPVAQARALDAIRTVVPDQPPFTAALVSIDPNTGYVRAAVSGVDFDTLQYDLTTHPPGRQPGSTYKVITLAAALEAGYSPNDTVDGTSPCTATAPGLPVWNTENAEPGGGVITLRQATSGSVNCAFAHVIASLGPPAVIDMAHRLGITQPVPDYLPITLGVKEATPLEMATVAATLASGGVHHDPLFVERVVAPDGTAVIDNTQPQGTRVVAQDVVDCETDLLHDVITSGTGTAAALEGRDAAGKTGTTDDHGDAWFLGFTPQLATVVWMGAPAGPIPMTDVGGIEVFGGTYPAKVWKTFMNAQLADQPAVGLPDPGPVCARAGASITDRGRGEISTTQLPVASQTDDGTSPPPDASTAVPATLPGPTATTEPTPVTTVPPTTTVPPPATTPSPTTDPPPADPSTSALRN
jgi:membrane peptidoglycan carboxypeptidase